MPLLLCLVVPLGLSQNLQSQTRIQFAELKSQQRHKSALKICNIGFNFQFVVLVLQWF